MDTIQTQQESTMQAEPQKEHHWLQKLVGEWTYETEAMMGPDQPPESNQSNWALYHENSNHP